MNTLSSLLKWIGNTIGADPNTLATTNKTIVGAINETHSVDFFHPAGSYYHTSDASFNPAIAWGGTWELLGEGQVLLSGSASGTYKVGSQYGGNTKSIGVTNLPSHTHTLSSHTHAMSHTHGTGSSGGYNNFVTVSGDLGNDESAGLSGSGYYVPHVSGSVRFSQKSGTGTSSITSSGTPSSNTSGSTGSGTAFNVMQLSTAVYIWHRTA